MHGYALAVRLEFQAAELDQRNWVVDFGGLKTLKTWLENTFDHKTCVAYDDPALDTFRKLHDMGLIDLRVVPATGCEAFAYLIFQEAKAWLLSTGYAPRVTVRLVEVREHGANSAIYLNGV